MKYKILTITYVMGNIETIEVVGSVGHADGVLSFWLREPLLNSSRNVAQCIKLDNISSWTVELIQ